MSQPHLKVRVGGRKHDTAERAGDGNQDKVNRCWAAKQQMPTTHPPLIKRLQRQELCLHLDSK